MSVPLTVIDGGRRKLTRRPKDPVADATAARTRQTKFRVLLVVKDNGPIVEAEIADLYRFRGARGAWDRVPSAELQEHTASLVRDGYLDVTGAQEAYELSDKGLNVLSLGLM